MTSLSTWKGFEREAAKFFGTTRFLPYQQNADKHSRDFETDTLMGECKYRSARPSVAEMEKWFATLEKRAAGKPCVLCIRIRGERGGFWVLSRYWSNRELSLQHSSWIQPVREINVRLLEDK